MGDLNRININVLTSKKNIFLSEKNNFNATTYATFNSSYFFTCYDETVKKMKQKLNGEYYKIQKLYQSIDSFFTSYLNDIEGIEQTLSNGSASILESQIYSVIQQLPELKNYQNNFYHFVYQETSGSIFKPNVSNGVGSGSIGMTVDIRAANTVSNVLAFSAIQNFVPNLGHMNQATKAVITSNVSSIVIELLKSTTKIDSLPIQDEMYQTVLKEYHGQIEEITRTCNQYLTLTEEEKNRLEQEVASYYKEKLLSIDFASYIGNTNNNSSTLETSNFYVPKGFQSFEEYASYHNELVNYMGYCKAAISEMEENKKMAKYECLSILEDFQNYEYNASLNPEVENYLNSRKNALLCSSNFIQIDSVADRRIVTFIEASEINPELKKTFSFLYENYGEDIANQYIIDIESISNSLVGQKQAQSFLDSLSKEEDIASAVTNHLKTTGKGLFDGIETFGEGVIHATEALASIFLNHQPSESYTVNEYETMYILSALTEGNYNGALLSNNYEISQGVGNMIPSMTLSAFNPALGSIAMGVSSGGNAYHGAIVEGYSNSDALVYGLIIGSSEAITERILGGIPGLSDVKAVDFKSFVHAIAKEGAEEGIQEIFDSYVRAGIFKEDVDIDELLKAAGKSALYGGITAGILQSPSAIMNGIKIRNINSAIESGKVTDLEILDAMGNLEHQYQDIKTEGKTVQELIREYPEIINKIIQNKVNNQSISSTIAHSSEGGESVGEKIDQIVNHTENQVNELLKKSASPVKAALGLATQFATLDIGHCIYTDVKNDIDFSNKILNEGLYHITSSESATKILESGYVKKSGVIASYGTKKSFFFAGAPSLENVAANVNTTDSVLTAVKFKVSEDGLADLSYRKLWDQAVTYQGDYHFEPWQAEIVHLGLTEENGNLVYKEIPYTDYSNYVSNIPQSKIDTIKNKLYTTLIALGKGASVVEQNVHNIKDVIKGINLDRTGAKVSEGKSVITENVNNVSNLPFHNEIHSIFETDNRVETRANTISNSVSDICEALQLDLNAVPFHGEKECQIYVRHLLNNAYLGKDGSSNVEKYVRSKGVEEARKELAQMVYRGEQYLNYADLLDRIADSILPELIENRSKEHTDVSESNLQTKIDRYNELSKMSRENKLDSNNYQELKKLSQEIKSVIDDVPDIANEPTRLQDNQNERGVMDKLIDLDKTEEIATDLSSKILPLDEQIALITSNKKEYTLTIEKLDETTLLQLSKIKNPSRIELKVERLGTFNLEKLNQKLSENVSHLKNEVLGTLEKNKLNSTLEIARKLYIELNKRLQYDMEYFYLGKGERSLFLEKARTQVQNFEYLTSNQVICKGWSELYQELLIAAGIPKENVNIADDRKCHWWIEIIDGDQIIKADATEALNGGTDLINAKAGLSTSGFLLTSLHMEGVRPSTIIKNKENATYIEWNHKQLEKVDRAIKYIGKKGYYNESLNRVNHLFGNTELAQKIMGMDSLNQKVEKLMNIPISENMNGYESWGYFRKIIPNILGDDSKRIDNDFISITNPLGGKLTRQVMHYFDENNCIRKVFIYDELNGVKIFDNYDDFLNFDKAI